MKKLIITLSIILSSIAIAILVVVLWPTNMEELKVTNYNGTELDLGKYKVNNFKREKYANQRDTISFDIENENDFYNDVIKKCVYYSSELDYDVANYYAYGYYCFDDCLFNYMIKDKNVFISACFVTYQEILDDETKAYKNYRVPGPFAEVYLNKDSFFGEFEYSKIGSLLNYNDIKELIFHLPVKFWCLQDGNIFMKGVRYDLDDNVIYSDYVLELFEKNGLAYVRLHS